MNRGVRADIKASKEKKAQGNLKLNRSKSKSRSRSPVRNANSSGKKQIKTSRDRNRDRNNRQRSPSLAKSKSKKALEKSSSSKKIKRNLSQPKIGAKPSAAKAGQSQSKKLNNSNNLGLKKPHGKKDGKQKQVPTLVPQKKPEPMIKQQQKDMGLILVLPEHQKIMLKTIDTLDEVFQKFLEMISNDNDASYVMNALPQFRDIRKDDDTGGRDFISGKITRLSGVFDNLTIEKVTTPLRKVPVYYNGQSGKNLQVMKIMLQTRFKIQVDLGFLQYSLDGDKITVFRIYISKIYRKMNYTAFAYLQLLKLLMEKHPAADRWSIFILERNLGIHKFFKFMGLKIEKVITDSKVKGVVDYYQEFTIKKKELQTAISAFK